MRSLVDLVAALLYGGPALLWAMRPVRRRRSGAPSLLVLDSSYTLAAVRDRGLQTAVEARSVGGFFHHVWSVHPLVGADGTTTATGPLTEVPLATGHTVIEAHVGRWPGLARFPLLNLACSQVQLVRRLRRLLAEEAIVAVRVGDPYYLGLLGLLLARMGRLPLVVRVNGNHDAIYEAVGALAYPRLFRRRSIEKRIDRFVLPRAALVFAPNEDNLGFALRNGADPEHAAVVPYGSLIDAVHFGSPGDRDGVRAELGVGDVPLLAYVSRLEPVKHPADVLDVLGLVRRSHPDAVAVIVGDGSLHDELLAAARAAGLDGALVLPGNKPQAWVASLLADADVVVAPMMGRALVEASLSATPIVAYDVDWHAELLRDGENGRLVPFRDVPAMAALVTNLLDDPAEAAAMGARARAETARRMAPDVVAAAERAAWERLLGPPAALA